MLRQRSGPIADLERLRNRRLSSCRTPTVMFERMKEFLFEPVDSKVKVRDEPGLEVLQLDGIADVRSDGRTSSIESAASTLSKVLISRAYSGEEEAIHALVRVASCYAGAVRDLSLEKPAILRENTGKLHEWPSMISFHPDWEREKKKIIEEIQLGKSSSLRRQTRITESRSPDQPFRHIVTVYCYRLHVIVDQARRWMTRNGGIPVTEDHPYVQHAKWLNWLEHCAALPRNVENGPGEWFKAAWEGMYFLTDGKPEELPGLLGVGASREYRSDAATNRAPGARRANLREGIRKSVKKAFMKRAGAVKPGS